MSIVFKRERIKIKDITYIHCMWNGCHEEFTYRPPRRRLAFTRYCQGFLIQEEKPNECGPRRRSLPDTRQGRRGAFLAATDTEATR